MSTSINLATLSPAQLADLFAQFKAQEAAEAAARKADRAEKRVFTEKFVRIITEKFRRSTFKSGAQGYSLGGTYVVDGVTWKVSVLIRDAATIPAKDNAAADAAESDV